MDEINIKASIVLKLPTKSLLQHENNAIGINDELKKGSKEGGIGAGEEAP